jgi:hypothetical protein
LVSNKKKKKNNETEYNGWRVLLAFIDGIFELINTHKVYPAFGLFILSILGLIVWRLPDTELAEIVKLLINEFVVSKGGLIGLLALTNLGWAYLLKRMNRIYSEEIDRLAKIRSELMHNGSSKIIESHRSSKEDCNEHYIIPNEKDLEDN